jgi:sec-independent protein translocase protein TatC
LGIFVDFIIEDILLRYAKLAGYDEIINRLPFGQPFLYFKVVLIAGIIIASPFILFQLWKFIQPGLYPKERKWVRIVTFFTSICFFAGVAFSYWIMLPSMLSFGASFGTKQIKNFLDVNDFFGFIVTIILVSGLVFELPMVSFVLAKIGILTSNFMRKYRRHSIIVILILAAVLTPTPDPISQLIFAAPLFVLYEISIWITKLAEQKHKI